MGASLWPQAGRVVVVDAVANEGLEPARPARRLVVAEELTPDGTQAVASAAGEGR